MSFSADAWDEVADWYDAILAHPFVSGLADGTLPTEVYTRYLLDDAHYLASYAGTLAMLSARAGEPALAADLARAAAEAVDAERLLHQQFLAPLGIDPDSPDAAEPTPTCRAYVGTLQTDAAYAPVEVGLAGVLPCFRVYLEVGRAIAARAADPDHPYRAWIDTYSDPAFDAAVTRVEDWTDKLAAAAAPGRRAEMLAAYVRATRFEWMFWDASWRGETWPEAGGAA
ncbi:thiaminase/transcriptional activator TenA [Mumia flava]|uniref:Thiaminase/transcriptional activator TenA n=1 Tax=Mumia flava TaxID=1348852 RepID=A0A0B2BUR8_9ACTN|nr:TenA family protein [Mumia flava]PJJ54077.1 thiaminase/transcriptional activator TenA [Mumia flava]